MKILPSGNGPADLSYATFLGGSGMDQALAIAVGTQLPGTAYVTGTTQSTNFPVTGTVFGHIAGYQPSLNGTANAFLAVIGQNGAGVTSLLYSTLFGWRAEYGRGPERMVRANKSGLCLWQHNVGEFSRARQFSAVQRRSGCIRDGAGSDFAGGANR